MRAGLVIYDSLDSLSGGYLYDRKLVSSLVADGVQVELYSIANNGYTKNLLHNIDPAWTRRLRTAPVDVMLQDELNHPSLVALNYRLKKQIPYPTVAVVHHLRGSESHPALLVKLYRWIERLYVNSVDGFIFNSRTTQASVEALLRTPKPAIVAYPAADHLPGPAMDMAEVTARAHLPGPLRILFVGNVIPRKGLHTLLAALRALDSIDWHLTVAGRLDAAPAYVAQLRQQAGQLALRDHVAWLGPVSDEALAGLYRQHHLLAVPSYEGFGIVYLEAMRFGLPVLATTAGAAHEIVTHGHNGFLVAPGAAVPIASAIEQLAYDRQLLLAMSMAALRRYQQHPSWEASMGQARAWLHAFVHSHHPSAQPRL